MMQTALICTMNEDFRALLDGFGTEGLPVIFNKRIIVRPSDGWWKGIIAPGYANGQMHDKVFHVASLVKRADNHS